MRPANVAVRLPDPLDGDVELMTARPADPRALAGRLWDLTAWSDRARDLLRAPRRARPRRARGAGAGVRALGRGAAAPAGRPAAARPSSCPPTGPGAALRATYDEWDARYRATLRDWSRRD